MTRNPSESSGNLAGNAKSGAVWTSVSNGIQAVLSIAAQLLLARWLLPNDFGLFALALSSSFVFGSVAGAGVRTMLAQQTQRSARVLQPGAFRIGLAASAISGLLLVASAPIAANVFGEPALVPLLLVFAAGLPVRSLANSMVPVMQVSYQFRTLSLVTLISAVVQYSVSVSLAIVGTGAMSLALGALAGLVSLSVLLLAVGGSRPWNRRGDSESLLHTAGRLRWPFAGDLATAASNRIDYLILGFIAPTAVVGGYYFAYQLVAGAATLIQSVASEVLYPVFSQIRTENDRQTRGLYRASAELAFVASVGAALVIATFPGIERLFWGGKWAYTALAVGFVASAIPLHIVASVPEQLLKARGFFGGWAGIVLLRSIALAGVLVALGLALPTAPSVSQVAGAVALTLAVSATVESAVLSRYLGFSFKELWGTTLQLWGPVVLSGWLGSALAIRLLSYPLLSIAVSGSLVLAASLVIFLVDRR